MSARAGTRPLGVLATIVLLAAAPPAATAAVTAAAASCCPGVGGERPSPQAGVEESGHAGSRKAQLPKSTAQEVAPPGSSLSVYLLTAGPGDAVWERFGHNAIRLLDPSTGLDVSYNWGLFSFQQENFIKRFLQGRMLYWMAGLSTGAMVDAYVEADRSVWAQELRLTAPQKEELRRFLAWNALEENRYYRYDYYRDNCSTRARDALDRVLGRELRAALDTVYDGRTFRSITRDLMEDDVPVHTGITLLIAHPTDLPVSAWEATFIPMELRDRMRDIRLRDGAGRDVPLVAREFMMYEAVDRSPTTPKPWLTGLFLVVSVALGSLVVFLGQAARIGAGGARLALAVLGSAWSLFAGLLGLLLVALWGFTDHWSTQWNENLFQVNPVSLVLVVLVPMALFGGWARAARRVSLIVATVAVGGFLLQLLPLFHQSNGEIIALALPLHVALALALLHALPASEGFRA